MYQVKSSLKTGSKGYPFLSFILKVHDICEILSLSAYSADDTGELVKQRNLFRNVLKSRTEVCIYGR